MPLSVSVHPSCEGPSGNAGFIGYLLLVEPQFHQQGNRVDCRLAVHERTFPTAPDAMGEGTIGSPG